MAHALKISTYGKGPKVVLLHGWGLNSGVWQPVVEQLSERFEIITVDLPGFGLNHDLIPKEYSLAAISELIINVIDTPAIYVGWSLGGLIASTIALDYPTHCKGLVTVASSPSFKQENDWPGIKPEFLQAFYHQLSKDIEQTLKSFLKIQAMGSPQIRKDLKQLQELILAYPLPDAMALKSGLDLLEASDLRSDITKISMPFMRLYGKLDSLVPRSSVEKMNSIVPNSEYVVFENSSHAPFISEQEKFIEKLSLWLEKIAPEA
jgi:pimeloyl-[acyl-carrier protein] methyl ester esterase